jgi:serine/threonine-protein kinase HipA
MEDFCQLAGKLSKEKYDASIELCFRLVKTYAAEPGVDALRLFRQVLFSWWIGNGDLHLKNLALLSIEPARPKLSPAFDLVSTKIIIPGDTFALPVAGKRDNLRRPAWIRLATYGGLPPKLAEAEMARLRNLRPDALGFVARSFLRDDLKSAYAAVIEERTAMIG